MSRDVTESSSSSPVGETDTDEHGNDSVVVGDYTWEDFMREHGYANEIKDAYRNVQSDRSSGSRFSLSDTVSEKIPLDPSVDRLRSIVPGGPRRVPEGEDWARLTFDPESHLGFHPDDVEDRLSRGAGNAAVIDRYRTYWFENTPVRKDEYTWEHFKWEYYYDEDGQPPHDSDGVIPFEPEEYLGFDPDDIESVLSEAANQAGTLRRIEDRRTVNVNPDIDEDQFFSTAEGQTTLVNRYDLEKAVRMEKKHHFTEVERYWVDKPYAFVVIFHTVKENEKKYYVIDPYLNEIEEDLIEFYSGKLRTSIKYSDDDVVVKGTDADRGEVLEEEVKWLLDLNNIWEPADEDKGDSLDAVKEFFGLAEEVDESPEKSGELEGIAARPEPAVLAEDSGWLTEYQVEKLLYIIRRDFIGYERIDPIKHDINVEDISCDGYDSPVFVYHTDYENLISNVEHGETRLDNFVIKLAQRSGKGISKRQPQVDATLPDGSRAQLTLGDEVSDHGTNYTIRQFKDVPYTPVDLVNWKTFSLDEMAFLWLCIESKKSLIFAGGTASGKTTSLNAVSLFIPSNAKIVSIEDTREVELPQRNWVASVTRPSFSQDNVGVINEFDLLEAALRQRPDYIVMGEVRGEEGRTLFQVMSTGHTTYTTFHADTVDEVLKRFTTDPINVSKTLFTALDLVSVQTQTKVQGQKVRRNKMITEINSYDAENEEISVQDIYQWQPEDDQFLQHGTSQKLQEIAFDRGWSSERLEMELFKRRAVLSYLITNGFNTYTEIAATLQAFINDPETVLTLIANGDLERSLENLREMESVLIDVDPKQEALVPRPEPGPDVLDTAESVLAEAEEILFDDYRGDQSGNLAAALLGATEEDDIIAKPGERSMLAALEKPSSAIETDGGTEGLDGDDGPDQDSDEGSTTNNTGGD